MDQTRSPYQLGQHSCLTLILLALLSLPVVTGAYYADTQFYIEKDGVVTVQGTSNHPGLTPGTYQNLTTTDDGTTTFTVDINDTFTNYVFSVTLPAGADLIDVSSSGSTRVVTDGDTLRVRGVAENKPFTVRIEYDLGESRTATTLPFVLAIIGMLITSGSVTWWMLHRDTWNVPQDVSERQRRILTFIHEEGQTTQQRIAEHLDIPKSSTSRNLQSLERQGHIKRVNKGNANTVMLVEEE